MQNAPITKTQKSENEINKAKQELYALLEEGYQAMKEGRVTPLEEVEKRLIEEEGASTMCQLMLYNTTNL